VIGGGPSAPAELASIKVKMQPVVISANEHAFKAGVTADYIFCKDHICVTPGYRRRGFQRQYMEPKLREYGVPIITAQYWGDYRAPGWPINNANSGMMALAVATLMGCRPIIGVGFDCFQGPTYFHDPDNDNVSNRRPMSYWNGRFKNLKESLDRTPAIRGFQPSVVAHHFGRFRHDEEFTGEPTVPAILRRYVKMPTMWFRARRDIQDTRDKTATIPTDYIFPSDVNEGGRLHKLGLVERVTMFDA
jgi:hypothetical protein